MKKSVRVAAGFLVALCLVITVGVHLLGPRIARVAAARVIQEMTGFETHLGEMELNLWQRSLELTDVRLHNPAGFEGGEAVWIRRLYAEPTWDAIAGRSATFRKVELDVAELFVVQPETGRTNMELLADNAEHWQSTRGGTPAPTRPEPVSSFSSSFSSSSGTTTGEVEPAEAATRASMETQIDELTVRLGLVNVVDHEHGNARPLTLRHEINREKTLYNVTDLEAVSEELLMEFTIQSLFDQVAEPLNDLMPGLADELQGFLQQLTEPTPANQAEGDDDPIDQFMDVLKDQL